MLLLIIVVAAVNHHDSASAVPSATSLQPAPMIKLKCDPNVGGTLCQDGGSAGTIALSIVGVPDIYDLCSLGYSLDFTDNHGDSSAFSGSGCQNRSGKAYWISTDPDTGIPYTIIYLPTHSETRKFLCGPLALTLRIKAPSGFAIRTARYSYSANVCDSTGSATTNAGLGLDTWKIQCDGYGFGYPGVPTTTSCNDGHIVTNDPITLDSPIYVSYNIAGVTRRYRSGESIMPGGTQWSAALFDSKGKTIFMDYSPGPDISGNFTLQLTETATVVIKLFYYVDDNTKHKVLWTGRFTTFITKPSASTHPAATKASPTAPSSLSTPPPPPASGDVPPSTDPGQTPVPARAVILGRVDLEEYCQQGWDMHAVLRFPNAWGWRCSASPAQASGERRGDQNIDTNAACSEQYGADARSHYRDYAKPNSWFCYSS